jgi:glycosyltransferase involved in cell wall biosynthesis
MVKISYLVSTYNAAAYLNRHLPDLARQTDPDFEVIVINSASPGVDGTIAKDWADRDYRFKYIEQPERTFYGVSWLDGWIQAGGEFVSNSNTDDYHHETFTASMYEAMKAAGPKVAFGYCGLIVVDPAGKVRGSSLKPRFDFDRYSFQCEGGPQLIWRNDVQFRNSLDWDLMYLRAREHRSAFDYWLMLYFMSLGHQGTAVQDILTVYTQRPDSIEHQNYGGASTYESLASISEFFPHHFRNRLKEFKEFADFSNLPPKDEWVAKRLRGEKWSH